MGRLIKAQSNEAPSIANLSIEQQLELYAANTQNIRLLEERIKAIKKQNEEIARYAIPALQQLKDASLIVKNMIFKVQKKASSPRASYKDWLNHALVKIGEVNQELALQLSSMEKNFTKPVEYTDELTYKTQSSSSRIKYAQLLDWIKNLFNKAKNLFNKAQQANQELDQILAKASFDKKLIQGQSQEIVDETAYRIAKNIESLVENINYSQIVSTQLEEKFYNYTGIRLRDLVDTQQLVDFYLVNAEIGGNVNKSSKAISDYIWNNINRYGKQFREDAKREQNEKE